MQTYVVDEEDEDDYDEDEDEYDEDEYDEESDEELTQGSEPLEGMALASANGCTGCHGIDQNIIGPAWSKVANRYRDDPEAEQKLIEAVSFGGSGNWVDETGGASMPPNSPRLDDEEIRKLVKFILELPGDAL